MDQRVAAVTPTDTTDKQSLPALSETGADGSGDKTERCKEDDSSTTEPVVSVKGEDQRMVKYKRRCPRAQHLSASGAPWRVSG